MIDYCPCDLCNGRLTGAWEDEQDDYDGWYDYSAYDDYEDPYADICPACGEMLISDDIVIHTMELCPAPWFWSAYEGNDREERIREYLDQLQESD